jgi:hypothetical protein
MRIEKEKRKSQKSLITEPMLPGHKLAFGKKKESEK